MDRQTARGIRNNNPLNLRITSDRWLGRVKPENQTDREYLQFVSPVYGLRAAMRVLRTYRKTRNISTVAGLITRWAPHIENPTNAYIDFVKGKTGITDWEYQKGMVVSLIKAMGEFENGRPLPYQDSDYYEAWELAKE